MARLIYGMIQSLDGYTEDELFPEGVRLDLELVEERRFGNGVVVLRYARRT